MNKYTHTQIDTYNKLIYVYIYIYIYVHKVFAVSRQQLEPLLEEARTETNVTSHFCFLAQRHDVVCVAVCGAVCGVV